MIQIGIHTDNWRPLSQSFETACQKIAAFGVRHIEFAVIHGQNFIQALGYDPAISLQANPRALRKYLEKLGLEVTQIDGSYPMMGPNGSAFGVQYVQQTVRFAAELGCPMVDTVDGALETPGFSYEEVFRITCDNYRQCLSWAEDYGVIINVETHGPYTSNLDFMTRLFEHFNSPYLRFNLDTGNTFIAGKDPLAFCKALRKYLSHCHIKDVLRRRWPPRPGVKKRASVRRKSRSAAERTPRTSRLSSVTYRKAAGTAPYRSSATVPTRTPARAWSSCGRS